MRIKLYYHNLDYPALLGDGGELQQQLDAALAATVTCQGALQVAQTMLQTVSKQGNIHVAEMGGDAETKIKK